MAYDHYSFISPTQFSDGSALGMKDRFAPVDRTPWSFGISEVKTGLSKFRFFIPPMSFDVNVTIMLTQPSEGLVFTRLGALPTGTGQPVGFAMKGFTESELLAGECVGYNSGGFTNVAKGSFVKGGWLYGIIKMTKGSTTNGMFKFSVTMPQYKDWHSRVLWDQFGDPTKSGAVINPPIPEPEPPPVVPPVEPPATEGFLRMFFSNPTTGENRLWEIVGKTKITTQIQSVDASKWSPVSVQYGLNRKFSILWISTDKRYAVWHMDGGRVVSTAVLGNAPEGMELIG